MKVDFELKGIMPLLMHVDDVIAGDALMEWRRDPSHKNISVPGDDRSPPWTWQTYLASDGEFITIPSEYIMVTLRSAGAQMILKKQKTYKEISQSGLLIDSEYCDFFVNGKQIPIEKYNWHDRDTTPFAKQAEAVEKDGFKLFVKRARVGTSKHVRVRPRFDNWTVRGSINILVPEITYEVLERLFEMAGRVGLGDWRPGCKTPGPYGMYSATLKKSSSKAAA